MGSLLQSLTVEDGDDPTPGRIDGPDLLQPLHCQRDAGAMHTEHEGHKLVDEWKIASIDAVVGQQQPACQSALKG